MEDAAVCTREPWWTSLGLQGSRKKRLSEWIFRGEPIGFTVRLEQQKKAGRSSRLSNCNQNHHQSTRAVRDHDGEVKCEFSWPYINSEVPTKY